MTDLIVAQNNLPTTLEDLSKFVLVGRDKLQAVRAEISAMQNLNLAKDVREQKLAEGQEIGKLVLLAEARLGELFNSLPKTTANNPNGNNQFRSNSLRKEIDLSDVEKPKPKLEVAKDMGFSKDQISQFQKLANNPDTVQEAIETANKHGEIVTRSGALTKIKQKEKEARQQETAERKAYTPPTELPTDSCNLICADIRDGLPQIADNSVDFIITDPPYPKEFLPLYADLSKVAARVLKVGGSLICMTGQSYLPEVIQMLASELNYQWCLCYLTPGGQSAQLFNRRVNTFWKPLLWFVKGNHSGGWVGDVLKSPVNDNDKNFHKWGQSLAGIKDIVQRFTNPNDVILDPFLGGGTTGVAAVTSSRKFIGVDIEQSCIDITTNRIQGAFNNA